MSKSAKNVTVHMIGNAHLDPVWLWRWTEGWEALVSTLRAALDFMSETEDFVFTCSSAVLFDYIERNEPAMFEEVQRRVGEGRLSLVGGWWLQPDCNIPSGESLVRQALQGQLYFREKFGVTATVGYNVDSFGHPATLPQLLAKAGLGAYIFFRPNPYEKDLHGGMFWWEAPDGTRVLAHHPPGHYPHPDDEVRERIRAHAAECLPGLADVASFYGVGNHGGGPTRAQIAGILAADADPGMPRVVFGRLDEFFSRVREARDDFPVMRDELQHHSRGCYTAHSGIKRWNRECEALLGEAEAFAALASELAEKPYPRAELEAAWRGVLYNQFHDILAGSALPEAYEDARDLCGEARSLAGRARWSALQALARRVDTRGEGQAVIAFNPVPRSAQWPIVMEIPFEFADASYAVARSDGSPVLSQVVQGSAMTGTRAGRLLISEELPPLGHRLYFVRKIEGEARRGRAPKGVLKADATSLENDRWRLEVDPEAGHIARLCDKLHGLEVFRGPAAAALVMDDPSDTWGHEIVSYRDLCGRFEGACVHVDELGPVRAALRVTSTFGSSSLQQTFRLYRGSSRMEVELEVDWHERMRMLKLAFPINVKVPTVTSSVPYGHIVRPAVGQEDPCGPWVDASGLGWVNEADLYYGVALVTDSRHGYDACGSELRLSVLRSPIYSQHDPWRPEPGRACHFMDQGVSKMTYLIIPHAGPWQDAGIVREGMAINRPPVAVNEFAHEGSVAAEWAGAEAGPENVILSALKVAEDGDGLVLRLWETSGRAGEAWARLPELGAEWKGRIGANEVKTLRARRAKRGWRWSECNLLEDDE